MLWTEKFNVVKLAHPDLVALGICKPLDALTHLPQPKLDTCRIWAKVDSDTMLFVLMPPSLEPSII
jgi:hypothetical protein